MNNKFNNEQEAIQAYINNSDKVIAHKDIKTWQTAEGDFCIRIKGTQGIISLARYKYNKRGQLVKIY